MLKKYLICKDTPKTVWLILLVVLINKIASSIVITFLSLYLHTDLRFSLQNTGLLIACCSLGGPLGNIMGGILSDIIQPKKILITCFILIFILFIIFPKLTSFLFIVILLLFYGFLVGMGQPANTYILNEYSTTETRLKFLGLYQTTQNIGVSLTGFLGGVIAAFNFKIIFYVSAIASIIAAIILLFANDSLRTHRGENPFNLLIKATDVFCNKKFIFFWGIVFLSVILFTQVGSTYTLCLNEKFKLSNVQIGMLFSINGLIIVMIQLPLLDYLSKYKLTNISAVGVLLIGVGFGILSLGSTFGLAIISCIFWTIGETIFFPVSQSVAINIMRDNKLGKQMGVYYLSFSVAGILSPLISTKIYQYFGYNLLWYISLISGVFLAFCFFNFLPKSQE